VFTGLFGLRVAVPMLTLTQIASNGGRVWFNRRHLQWRIIAWFSVGAIGHGRYLRPAMGRDNLTVLTGAVATKVLLDGGRAVGVRYHRNGTEQDAHASGEVVLCGGAIASPHLLLLSGIGPGEQLREHGRPVIRSPRC
jgi:hypothetical protein